MTTPKVVIQRTVHIPLDGCRVGCHAADAAIRACVEQDSDGKVWWQKPLYETHRVVGLHREGNRWTVTVESSKRI